jgi:C-terminal processing protease CtpA/Prc
MKKCLLLFVILFLCVPPNFAQGKPQIKLNSDDPVDLQEVGAYIIKEKDKIKVQFVAPENKRLPGYQNVDLKKDDIILKVNGHDAKKLSELKESYENLKVGRDLKLEVKRGKNIIMVAVKKADPKILPKRHAVNPDFKKMENKVLLEGYGILIANINEKPMIEKLLMDNNELVKKAGLKGGDLLTNINGQEIKTFIQFKKAYERLNPGQNVKIKFGIKYISFKKK